jgi:hypothetical protein
MDTSDLFKQKNRGQLILAVILVIYLLVGNNQPTIISKLVNTIFGTLIIIVVTIAVFMKCNIVLGVLLVIVAFSLINNSANLKRCQTNNYRMNTSNILNHHGTYENFSEHIPSEEKKYAQMKGYNKDNSLHTLEEEIVKTMTVNYNDKSKLNDKKYSFSPISSDSHNAVSVN